MMETQKLAWEVATRSRPYWAADLREDEEELRAILEVAVAVADVNADREVQRRDDQEVQRSI